MAPILKTNHVEAYLEIKRFQNISHDDISTLLGLQPTTIYVQGQRFNPHFGAVSRHNRWLYQVYTKEGPWRNLEEQLDELLALVNARRAAFQQLAAHCEFEIRCAVFIYYDLNESTPPVFLEPRHVELLNFLQAGFDADIYCRSSK